MRKLIKVISIIILSFILTVSSLGSPIKVSANADTDYLLNYYGLTESDCYSGTISYIPGSKRAFYASVGKTATTGIRYRTIGATITCTTTGESSSYGISDSGVFQNESRSDGTDTYTVSKLDFGSILNSMPKAESYYASGRKLRFTFNSIMTITINGVQQGTVDSNGSKTSRWYVYSDAAGIQQAYAEYYNSNNSDSISPDASWYKNTWGSRATFGTYFNKEFTVWNGLPEVPDTTPYLRGMNSLKG